MKSLKNMVNKKEKNGLTGWLTPDGVFFECKYSEHNIVANKLIEKYSTSEINNNLFVHFTSGASGEIPAITAFNDFTRKQLSWVAENLNKLSSAQINIIKNIMSSNYTI